MASGPELRILVDLALGSVKQNLAAAESEFRGAFARIKASGGNLSLISASDLDSADRFLRTLIQSASIKERLGKFADKEVTARDRLNRLIEQSGQREEQRQRRMLTDAASAAKAGGARFGFQTQAGNAAIMSDVTAAVRGMPMPALTGGLGVFGPAPQQAASGAIAAGMAERAGATASAISRVAQEGDKAANSMQRLGMQGKFSIRVLEAFVLYRGFLFLEQSITGSVRAMMDLDRQVSLILTQMPNFGAGLRGVVTREILDVSRETGMAFKDVADALYQVTSAGFSGKAAFDALELSAKAAVAGGTDVSNAFNAALAQMNAFGLGVDSLSSIYDKQFNLVRRGIFNYSQLTSVIGITAEAFEQAGQSMETQNAALATVSQVFTGTQLNRGATALRNLILAVADKPDAFAKLGVQTRDVDGNVRDLIPVLDDLKKHLDTLSTGERATAIADILPDQRQRAGVLALLQNMDSLKRNYMEQELALGDLDKAYKEVHGDIRAQSDILKTNVQSGFKPLASTVGLTFEGINKIDKILPGFTSNLIGTTAAITAMALAWQYLNQTVSVGGGAEVQQLSRMAALRQFIQSPAFRYGGAAVIGSGIGGALGSRGASIGGALAGIGGGAAAGAAFGVAGGPQGIAVGAAVGAITSGISYAINAWRHSMEDTSKAGGRSFAEAFAEALKENRGELAGSLAKAFDAARVQRERNAVSEFLSQAAAGRIAPLGTDIRNIPDVAGGSSATRINQVQTISAEEAFRRTREAALGARNEFNSPSNLAAIKFYVNQQNQAGAGLSLDQFTESARSQFIQSRVASAIPGSPAAQQFTMQMLSAVDNLEVWNKLVADITANDLPKFYDDLQSLNQTLEQTAAVMDLSSNSFADALHHAADVVRNGMADSAGYTADELEMLGEEFADLNKVVKKVGLVKELEGIGQFLFNDPGFQLKGVHDQLLEQARAGGQSIKDLLNDPNSLLKLVDTLIEFGDVNVDQSTNNNIVVRISGGTDLDTLKAAEVADAILKELNNKQRATR